MLHDVTWQQTYSQKAQTLPRKENGRHLELQQTSYFFNPKNSQNFITMFSYFFLSKDLVVVVSPYVYGSNQPLSSFLCHLIILLNLTWNCLDTEPIASVTCSLIQGKTWKGIVDGNGCWSISVSSGCILFYNRNYDDSGSSTSPPPQHIISMLIVLLSCEKHHKLTYTFAACHGLSIVWVLIHSSVDYNTFRALIWILTHGLCRFLS